MAGLPIQFVSAQRVSVEILAGYDRMLNPVEDSEDWGASFHLRGSFLATDRFEVGAAYGLTRGERPRGCVFFDAFDDPVENRDCSPIRQNEFHVYLVDARFWPMGRSARGAGLRPLVGASTGVVHHRTRDGIHNGLLIGLEGGLGVQLGGRVHLLTVIAAQGMSLHKPELPSYQRDGFGVRLGLRSGLAIRF